jgi:hypothetical protein
MAKICPARKSQEGGMKIMKDKKAKKLSGVVTILICLLIVLFALPLSAKENAIIKLPDGLYMYDSWIENLQNGDVSVRFEKYFIVKNNVIYNSNEAIKKYGISKLNESLTENKHYKILQGGEKIGEIDVKIEGDGYHRYEEKLLKKNIKEGPAYGRESIYLGRLGSAAKYIAVPEKYKETPTKFYNTISKEEIEKVSKLAKDKLFALVKNRKEIIQYLLMNAELKEEYIELVDKISDRNDEMYIGIYRYNFKIKENDIASQNTTIVPSFEIAFSIKKDKLDVITSDYDGEIEMCGILDVDSDGKGEMIISKTLGGEDGATITMEIYKQKKNGNWALISKLK